MNEHPSRWTGLACSSRPSATPSSYFRAANGRGLVNGAGNVEAKEQGLGGDDAIPECEGGLATVLGGGCRSRDGAAMSDAGYCYHWSLPEYTTRTWLRPHTNPRLLALLLHLDGLTLTRVPPPPPLWTLNSDIHFDSKTPECYRHSGAQ
jgi:hypothetical protein